ncbi:hypothetical protein ARMSODRAFT_1025211 [Armillaria solidipes]|uniref:Uncharacterized protein n=1 Tax=Armillaria solidipes TaxID=1076256 RepID=A0A2H3ATM5_9AGAR|nr:hypothetical protein ARMSODRAFT_1025211 [Armillaria solidipes]
MSPHLDAKLYSAVTMKSLPVDYASLVGVWCGTVLYGVNLVLYFSCVNLLIRRRWWLLLGSATFQFIISTIHIAAGLHSLIEGFIWSKDTNGAVFFWGNQARLVDILQESATITNCIACDAIMLWRLYVIWNKSVKVSVPPAAMVLAFGGQCSLLAIFAPVLLLTFKVCGYISIYQLSCIDSRPESMQILYRWLQASYSLSLATQLSVTTMIVVRIWWLSQRVGAWKPAATSKPSTGIIWMIVESGAISAITSTLFLAFFNTDANISIILANSLGQISAIAPALILFRVALDTEVRKNVYEPSHNLPNTAVNITFHHTGTFQVLACNVSEPKNLNVSSSQYFLAKSQRVQVQEPKSGDDKQHNGHNGHGNEDDGHRGNGSSGGSGSTQTVNAVPLASPASSNTSLDASSALARASPPALAFCVLLGLLLLLTSGPI